MLNGAGFEWDVHCPLAVAEGVGKGVLGEVRDRDGDWKWIGEGTSSGLESRPGGPDDPDEEERIVLAYADAMTRDVVVGEGLFERVRGMLGDRGTVELTAAVAGYNCVSRFLVALDVGERNGVAVGKWKIE